LVNSLKQQNVIFDNKSRPRFDDSHIVSITIISKCNLVCTKDQGLNNFIKINFLRKNGSIPKSGDVPLIYSQLSNKIYYLVKILRIFANKIINKNG
jgi:hypothetical protein